MSSEGGLKGSAVIAVRGLGKCYRVYDKPSDRLIELLSKRTRRHREYWALRGVDFDVARGETVGIIGRNGAGKSTLLQIIAGIIAPTQGEVRRVGRTFGLLELGSGFNPEFAGRENISTSAAILGVSEREAAAAMPAIVAFADIGEYIDHPVKTYSTGMYARLAMAVALHLPADILLIDEILAVGDVFFQIKCYERIRALMREGRTVLLCSHDLGAIRRHCSRVLYFEGGRLVADGDPDDVLALYLESEPNASGRRREAISLAAAPEWQPDDRFAASVRSPRGLAAAPNGNLVVADLFSHAVHEVTREGHVVRRWGRQGFGPGAVYDPVGLEARPDGGVAVADYSAGRLATLYADGRTAPLLEGAECGAQAFLVRFAPDGRAWVASRAECSLRIVERDGHSRPLFGRDSRRRYVTDVAFVDGRAYLADMRNCEILVFDPVMLVHERTIDLSRFDNARGPHGLARVGDRLAVACHDSHSLVVMPLAGDGQGSHVLDLRHFVIEHPCYLLALGDRLYVSASTLGAVTAFDVADWPGVCSGNDAPMAACAQAAGSEGAL